MKTSHEEADVIIPHQVRSATIDGYKSIKVVCDDTDVFFLLLYFFFTENWMNDVFISPLQESRTVISIKETIKKHSTYLSVPQLLSMHALSGCDTVPKMNGVGKITALNVLKKTSLDLLGEIDANIDDVVDEAKKFVAACYGVKDSTDMSEIR